MYVLKVTYFMPTYRPTTMPSGEEGGHSPPPKDTTMPLLYLMTLAQYYEQYLGQHLATTHLAHPSYPRGPEYHRGHACERCAT